jgi:GNAT superfamily N-acetyltransferase
LTIQQITGILTAVGFSSPPSWVKPYCVLSGGERFRCDLARGLAVGVAQKAIDCPPIVAFDEFTSVVDRNVACLGSAAIAKGIRSGQIRCRFVAVTCHYDILEWLAPDWIIDMATREFAWCDVDDGAVQVSEPGCPQPGAAGAVNSTELKRNENRGQDTPARTLEDTPARKRRRLRRPPIELRLFRCKHALWQRFARHHYLSGSLSKMARCYVALWNDTPVAFCATLPVIGKKKHRRISRIVTLPDYQGVGIGMRVAEAVADLYRHDGFRLNVTASHPALLAHCRKSPKWRAVNVKKTGAAATHRFIPGYRSSRGRAVVSFEYVGER